uniref:Type II methyltransferase M.MamI n=1 Tax=Microbacterium ammoniaphilum TaxID=42460 RepID=MTM1_MICAM|nr:RecName: Full=Type II methyltransferase M.MamI; Short=M.MamI; AltName: Full=Adenine-specific methyltransferase MamI; AltName: Full=Modification methylase MamI [Microbacterium ammoniaphilum]CAA55646.1 methyltransferase [Microbacterium ammoniaphilum]
MRPLRHAVGSSTVTLETDLTLFPEDLHAPLLGSAGNATVDELALAARFDGLHQLLYTRGGVRPTNAAIEEVGKLLLLRLWLSRDDEASVDGVGLRALFDGAVPDESVVEVTKKAFTQVLTVDRMSLRAVDGSSRPLWPYDEPFRLAEPTVLQSALALVNEILGGGTRVADPLGTAFDAFLSGRYDHSGGLGTYLTPSSVARMMAEVVLDLLSSDALADVRAPIIADPFCGTGRFLVAAFDAAEERHENVDLAGLLDGGLVGADQSTTAIAKSGLNLLLYGAQQPEVYAVADSMTDPGLDRLRGTLAAVLTNPPFGGGKYDDALGIDRTRELFPSVRPNRPMDPRLLDSRCLSNFCDPGESLG